MTPIPGDDTRSLEATARTLAVSARGAKANVRAAVRDLTLQALRGRMLTVSHLADVAQAVSQGIADSREEARAPKGTSLARAYAGLAEALAQGLNALEIATRSFADGHGRLPPVELERLLSESERLAATIEESWKAAESPSPAELRERIAQLESQLRRAQKADLGETPDAGRVLGLLASGALLGIAAGAKSPASPGA